MLVKDDFANICGCCGSPTFRPLTFRMTLITINDDSDDKALLSARVAERKGILQRPVAPFGSFMRQKTSRFVTTVHRIMEMLLFLPLVSVC